MRKLLLLVTICLIANISQAQSELWKLTLDADNHKETVTLTRTGNTYKGTLNDGGSFNATFKANKFTGYFKYHKKLYKLKGEKHHDIISGTSFYGKYCACSGEPDKIFTLVKLNKIATTNMQGTWNSNFGELRLLQNGSRVFGDYKNVGTIKGTIKGNLVSGTFTNGSKSGIFKWILDDKSFTGTWAWNGQNLGGKWNATLKSIKKPVLKNSSNNTNLTTRRNGLNSSNSNNRRRRTRTRKVIPSKPKDYSGKYRITVTNIYTSFMNLINSKAQIYGMIGVRLKGKGKSGEVEIKSIGNKKQRIWDYNSNNAISTVKTIPDPKKYIGTYGAIEVDKMREYSINGELANANLMVNIQINLKEKNLTSNTKFGWKQRNLYVKDMQLGKEYFIEVKKD